MSRVIAHGATDQSTVVRLAYGNGTLRTDVTAGTGNIAMQYRREGGTVTDAGTVGNLASGAAAHTDAGIVHLTGAYYRVDPPDAAWASGAAGVLVTVSGDDITCIGAYHPLGPQAADVQAWDGNTTNISVSVDGAPVVALVDGAHGGSSATLGLASADILGNFTMANQLVSGELTVGLGTSLGDLTANASGVTNISVAAIAGIVAAATRLAAGAQAAVSSTCSTGSTASSIVTNLTETTDDHYVGRVISFYTGALAGQSLPITAYNGTTKTLTVTAVTADAPANTDAFVIT